MAQISSGFFDSVEARRFTPVLRLLLAALVTVAATSFPLSAGALIGPSPDPQPDRCGAFSCDDRNPCTIDQCVNGECLWLPVADGSACDDGEECTLNETCQRGTCTPSSTARDGNSCDDGKVCTVGEVCLNGACTAADPEGDLPDGTPCYTDLLQYCQTAGVCLDGECAPQPPADGTSCDDGDPCTGDDQCVTGQCLGTPIWCPPVLPPFGGDDPTSNLPDPPGVVIRKDPPGWKTPPEDPFGNPDPEEPSDKCSPGFGWSFNDGTFQKWTPKPSFSFGRRPVFGNNVDINRIMPPGYTNQGTGDPSAAIGGDYWRFSRDVNQKGLWWIGSSDARPSREDRPGTRLPENKHGTLTSPEFEIDAPYIAFYIGGTKLAGERVELLVKVQGLPDIIAFTSLADGIGRTEFPKNWQYMPPPSDPPYMVVRSSANTPYPGNENPEFMQRHVVWDVSAFVSKANPRKARLRIVDIPTPVTSEEGHINADDFRCLAAPPEGTTWLTDKNGAQSAIGHVIEPVPVWGFTDSHAHVLSNLAFGGHFAWGDPSDELAATYDCSAPLPDIKDLAGNVVRPGEPDPDQVTQCKVDPPVLLAIASEVLAVCYALSVVPYIGNAMAAVCAGFILATGQGIIDQPILTAESLHGSEIAIGGGIDASLWWDSFFGKVVKGAGQSIGFDEHVHGVIEILDFDQPDGKHSKRGGSIHQNFQKDMIRRAWQGGLRLIGLDTINGRLMENLIDGNDHYGDWQAIEDMIEGTKRLVAGPADPKYPVGPLYDIAAIAYTPGEAREIIAADKIAIVLGTEVGELGKARFPGDSETQQVEDLFAMGVRKITAIHGEDNPFGGSGIFNDIYPIANHFNNVTLDENGDADGAWVKAIPEELFLLSPVFPIPFGLGLLGGWTPFTRLEAPQDQNSWNLENNGWFRVSEIVPDDWIGGYQDITFRFGLDSSKPLSMPVDNGKWAKVDEFGTDQFQGTGKLKQLVRASSLDWMMEDDSLMCTLAGGLIPLEVNKQNLFNMQWPQSVIDNYSQAAPHGHFNAVGLRDAGKRFLWGMMEHGMVMDLDHFSQKSRVDAFELTDAFGAIVADLEQAPEGAYVPGYPTFGVHVDVRGMSRHGPPAALTEMMDTHGWGAETDRTLPEFEKVRLDGGALSPGANAGVFDPKPGDNFDPKQVAFVTNDCDYSSKPAALKYLTVSRLLKGRGVTMSADMGGPVKHAVGRFGAKACHLRTGPQADGAVDEAPTEPTGTVQWPRDWTTDMVAKGCAANAERAKEDWDSLCASTQSLEAQYAEGAGVEYEDYQNRVSKHPNDENGQPVNALKYVLARTINEVRDDDAPRAKRNEWVAIGNARQMAPLKKMMPTVHGSWDINLDGLQHMGLYPDYIQDMRNIGVLWEDLTPMFNAAEDYIRMWERQCHMANVYRISQGADPIACD